ncbi:mediator of DNA damage checkpoint protein 1 isoform X2 [Rhagoletis pomonella]|uniref:mediator of DNA damage checkpoint protein 1 isoform X2 n=1 Tax=Rhagoletis pomonella TaxID=28610 RepID=UPI0017822A2D|nr:mediator of DNA damage checkpoint protein 1 isoform X2 [Rhagoletis pomonella]
MPNATQQDFNENLFENGEDDMMFSSIVIPNIKHNPVVLTHSFSNENVNKKVFLDASKPMGCDAEMEALNWSAHTSKNCSTDGTAECAERDDVCTPDLFDIPELAQMNMQVATDGTNVSQEAKDKAVAQKTVTANKTMPSTEGTNINLEVKNKVDVQESVSSKNDPSSDHPALPISDGITGGDGYAEEIELMPTQVFVPIAKQNGSRLEEHVTCAELSLSGKENIPQTDFSLEQTQIFAPIKDRRSDNNCNSSSSDTNKAPTTEPSDRDINLLAATQIFTSNFMRQSKVLEQGKLIGAERRSDNCNSASLDTNQAPTTEPCDRNINLLAATQIFTSTSVRQSEVLEQGELMSGSNISTPQEKPNCTVFPSVEGRIEGPKSVTSSFEDKNNTSQKSEFASTNIIEKKRGHFKKPKQSKSSSSKGAKDKHSSISSSQSELDDLQLCTPKWITDNFDDLSVERNVASVKKRMLFGSDSEEESVELNKLTTKKDSKDFDRLLSNIKETKAPVKLIKSKTLLDKQEDATEVCTAHNLKATNSGRNSNMVIETVRPIKKEENTPKKAIQPEKEGSGTSKNNLPEPKKTALEIDVESRARDKIGKDSEHKGTKRPKLVGSLKDAETSGTDVPPKRKTRLRSRASDLEVDKPSNSSGPTQSKLRKVEQTDAPENKKRVTRSRSKTESQESIVSTKSTGSSRDTRKRKNSRNEHTESKINSSADKTITEASKHTKANERKETRSTTSASDHSHKRNTIVSSDDEPKNSKRTARTLQVAMTMVEPKLFQSLVDNSPGNWCVANNPTDADVLVMDKGNRTLKFLIAMAKGIPIVTSKWLETFNSTKTVPRGATHFFRDQEFEKRHKFSLFKSLELARKSKIFEGYDFLTTPGILPQPAEIKQIIECAGGKVHTDPPGLKPNQKIYLISTVNDKKHWHKYRRSNSNIRIINSEGVMASVMRQNTQPLDSNIFA